MMRTAEESSTSYAVDAEHGALRFAVIILFIILWVLTFILLNAVIPNSGFNIIALFLSFGITAVLSQQIEKLLKQRWPSGRKIVVTPSEIRLQRGDTALQSVDAHKQVNVLLWRFQISRRSRVPKGWYMMALALEQDENYLPVYTFISPDQLDGLRSANRFTTLMRAKDLKDGESGPAPMTRSTDLRLAGEQRRLHQAENIRWMEGAEMTSDDFFKFIDQLQGHFPQWMPSLA